MSGPAQCSECGRVLRPALLDGLCPSCVIRHSLGFARVVAIADSPIADRLKPMEARPLSQMRVGDYQIEAEIARGGMGVVYRARQLGLNRLVALKLLLAGQFADAGQVKRFRAEAAAVARLDHPAIVPVYEVGEFENRHFFSMRLIEGPSLAGAMSRFALPASLTRAEQDGVAPGPRLRERQRDLSAFMAVIARAVHYAHQRGVLHRDLKPANVLLDSQENPHVTDFGLARCVDSDAGGTGTGVVFGTPAYMPPEQTVDPHNVTVAADVYSLGAITYELLTGRPPFEAGSPFETVIQVREREPMAPRALEPAVDRDLETIVLKCLEKDPSARYETALALAEELERFTAGEPVLARPVSTTVRTWRWARRHPTLAALSGAVTALLLTLAIGGPALAFRLAEQRDEAKKSNQSYRKELQATHLAQARAERLRGEVNHREEGIQAVKAAAEVSINLSVLNEAVAQLVRFDIPLNDLPLTRSGRNFPVACRPDFTVYFEALPGGIVAARSAADQALLWTRTHLPSAPIGRLWACPDNQLLGVEQAGRLTMLQAQDGVPVWSRLVQNMLGFNPDGSWLLVQQSDRSFKRINASTGEDLPFAARQMGLATEFALAPDPSLPVLARLRGKHVELLDWEQDRVLTTLEHSAPLEQIVWTDHRIVATDQAGNVMAWLLPSRRPVLLRERIRDIKTLRFIPHTPLLLIISEDGRTSCWDTDEDELIFSNSAFHPDQVSADGSQLLCTVGQKWGISRMMFPSGRTRFRFNDGEDPTIRQVAFSPDARFMAVVKQGGLHLLDLVSRQEPAFMPHFGAVACFFVPETNLLVLQGRRSVRWIAVTASDSGPQLRIHHEHRWSDDTWLEPGTVSPAHPWLLLPRGGAGLEFLGLLEGQPVKSIPSAELGVSPGIDQAGEWIVYRRRGEAAPALWGADGPVERQPFTGDDFVPRFSPDGHWLLASARHHHRVFAVADWTLWRSNSISSGSRRSPLPSAWAGDSRRIALYDDLDGIVIRDVKTWSDVVRLTTPLPSAFTSLTFSPGGRWLAAGTARGSVELWDFAELESALHPLQLTLNLDIKADEARRKMPPRSLPRPRLKLPPEDPSTFAPRDPATGPAQLDLTPHYNAHLEQSWSLIEIHTTKDSLAQLPSGLGRFDGVLFDVRGVIQLAGERFATQPIQYPAAVEGVRVAARVKRLHLLGAVVDGYRSIPRGVEVGWVRLRYRGGGTVDLPLRLGSDLEDHWVPAVNPRPANAARVAWWGMSGGTELLAPPRCEALFHVTLDNPDPDREVEALDLLSAGGTAAPFLVAITVE